MPKLRLIKRHDGKPYLLRLTLFNIFGYSLKLHIFLSSDIPIFHDHPFAAISFIVYSGYKEHILNKDGGYEVCRYPGNFLLNKANHAHWVELYKTEDENSHELVDKPCITLFFTFPKTRNWGFFCPKEEKLKWITQEQFHEHKGCE
jgi:hypothetical protein